MVNENFYIFVGKIALEFRLSLDNVCKILGKKINDENKMEIYNTLSSLTKPSSNLDNMYKYLFFYETLRESENASKIAYAKAINYIKRYKKIKQEGNSEKIKEILNELDKTENDFGTIKNKFGRDQLTQEDIEVITKYRIKKVISRTKFCQLYDVGRINLEQREKSISYTILKAKLQELSEFFYHFENEKLRKKAK